MSIDDVVIKTVSLLGAAVLAAAATWAIVPLQAIGPVWIAAMLVGLVLGLIISFAQITNPVLLFAYALVEGVFLGAASKAYDARWNGIVPACRDRDPVGVLRHGRLYKLRIIRASAGSPKSSSAPPPVWPW
jgi:flagellar biosynthesis protein FliQ